MWCNARILGSRIVSIVSGRRSSEQSISLLINCWAIRLLGGQVDDALDSGQGVDQTWSTAHWNPRSMIFCSGEENASRQGPVVTGKPVGDIEGFEGREVLALEDVLRHDVEDRCRTCRS